MKTISNHRVPGGGPQKRFSEVVGVAAGGYGIGTELVYASGFDPAGRDGR